MGAASLNNIFSGIPLIESPLFFKAKENWHLDDEETKIANDLHENGYAIFDFPDHALFDRIDRIQGHLGPRYGIDFDNAESNKTTGERRIQDAWKFDEDVHAIAANRAIIDLLSKLYGRNAFPFQTLNFPVGTQQEAHSDSVHFSSIPERFMCGVWLAMEDIGPDAGPLFYYPGSHRWPIITNGLIGRRGYGSDLRSAQDPYGPAWQALCDAHGAQQEFFLPRKGQALIWCANLLHGGSHQNDPRLTRWSQVTHYYFDDCIYYTPAFSDEALGKLMVRNPMAIHDGSRRNSSYLGEMVEEKSIASKKVNNSLGKRILKRIFG